MNVSLLTEQLGQQDVVEWAGLLTGILYIILAIYERPLCWAFGAISAGCIGWKSFTDYFLIADGVLQLFYVVISVIGLLRWMRGAHQIGTLPIVTSGILNHLTGIAVCLVLSFPISWFLLSYTDARYSYIDTLLMALSVWTTILLVRKDLHNWVYWIIIDLVYVLLYWKTEGYLFAFLFVVYAVFSFWGWWRWQKEMPQSVAGTIRR